MSVLIGYPYAKVSFATETGELTIFQKNQINIDSMDADILSIQTSRDVGGNDCATFTITLVYKDEWYNRIAGNDFVQIDLGRNELSKPVLFGMVDSVYKSEGFIDLKPVRTIEISGRGFNKALIQFGIGAIQELDMVYKDKGFFEGMDMGISKCTPQQAIRIPLDFYMNKGIDINFANGKSWKSYIDMVFQESDDLEESLGNITNYYSYQGGLWDLIKELRNAPFNEVFWEIVNDKPTIICRPTPFNPNNWNNLAIENLKDQDLIDDKLGRTDLETYTVYSVKGESIVSNATQLFGTPVWYKPFYKKYGVRRLEVVSKYIHIESGTRNTSSGSSESAGTLENPVIPEITNTQSTGKLVYPVPTSARLTSPFGYRVHPITKKRKMHEGIDLALASGSPVYAAGDGIITKVGSHATAGNYIRVLHDNGLETRYLHLKEKPNITVGTRVSQGSQIGKVGSTGASTGPHLHFEVRKNGQPVDPQKYISKSVVGNGGKGSPGDNSPSDSVNVNEHKESSSEKMYKQEFYKNLNSARNRAKEEDLLLTREKLNQTTNMILGRGSKDSQNNMFSLIIPSAFNVATEVMDSKVKVNSDKFEEDVKAFGGTYNSGVSQKTIDLFNWNIKNNVFENGSIMVRGDSKYKVGTRLYIESLNMEYYIENVTHSFIYGEEWTTTLELTRGIYPQERFTSPWNEWEMMLPEDVAEMAGIDPSKVKQIESGGYTGSKATNEAFTEETTTTKIDGDLRSRIRQNALKKEGQAYSQTHRMSEDKSDCSSFVFKTVMEAKGKSWKGLNAPSTKYNQMRSDLWEEIPLSEAKPWDILWRPGHTEFLGDNGRTYGAHSPKRPAGEGAKFSVSAWKKAYRVKG